MFWNIENLFDTVHDEGKSDEEFTPDGQARWTEEKLEQKMKNLAKVILSVKTTDGRVCPDFLGLAEVEHQKIAETFNKKHLGKCGYTSVLADEKDPDIRGIRNVTLTRLQVEGNGRSLHTYPGGRFIREVTVNVNGALMTLFVNHWKSRRPGSNGDDGSTKRAEAAMVLRKRVLQLQEGFPERDLMAMGDFNDEPENKSFTKFLGSTLNWSKFSEGLEDFFIFWNPAAELVKGDERFEFGINDRETMDAFKKLRSTFYFGKEKQYLALDNFHLSKTLFDGEGFSYEQGSYKVVRHPDFTDPMQRPIPNRSGAVSKGVADHFPILARFKVAESKDFTIGF